MSKNLKHAFASVLYLLVYELSDASDLQHIIKTGNVQ